MYVLKSSQRYRNKAKLNKVMTLEDVDSSTTIALSPVIHKQQPEDKHTHSHVQDLYPPTNPHSSLPVTANIDHKTVKNVLPELPHPYSQALPKTSVEPNAPPWTSQSAVSTTSANSTLDVQVVQDVDNSPTPVERRIVDARCVDKESTAVTQMKHQSSGKRRRKRVKTTSPKVINENSSREKLELKRPVTEDICNWLQLEASESRERVSKSCDQSVDLPAVAGNSDSQDTEQLTHHQNTLTISTDVNRSSTQGVSLPVPSPIVQQQRLSETSGQPTTCKH